MCSTMNAPSTAQSMSAGRARRSLLKQSLAKAVLTDIQFWLPVAVLAFGIGLLAVLR
jgi:hypothetical protein